MDYFFDDWKKALEDFKGSVTKDLEEIRQYKEEIRQLKGEINDALSSGYFLRDDHRIVISAPEIILGNVDRDGVMIGTDSHVVIRSHSTDLEGVGEGGRVQTRASSIRQIAVDPGIDGEEAVVGPVSEVVSQAGSIVLESNGTAGVFSQAPHATRNGGIRIHADGLLEVEASVSADQHKQRLEALVKDLEDQQKELKDSVESGIKSFESLAASIKQMYEKDEALFSDEMTVRTELSSFVDAQEKMSGYAPALYDSYVSCIRMLSRLAEINRQIACLKDEEKALKKPDDFKKELTGSAVSVIGECVRIMSQDGDGNLRDNEGAGVGILANDVKVEAVDAKNELQKEGKILLHAMGVEVSTANAKDLKYDDKGKLQSGEYPAEGDITLRSKTVSIEAVDQEYKDDKMQEKAFTKESSLNIRVEKTDVSATDTEGKATGSIALNAKDVSVRSMDVDKEKRTDDKLAAGSTMLLLSEKMFLGAKKKDIKSKKLQAVSEEVGLFADKTFEAQQDDGKAALQLAGGKAALGGSDTQVFGKTTVNNTLEAKGEFKAPKATIDHVEAKSSFKSSNISDGIPVPPAPPSGNLSAKLKAEDAPEKK